MTLRRQLLILVAGIMTAVAAVLMLGLSLVLLHGFGDVERSLIEADLKIVRRLYAHELEAMDTIARDWAWWDDSCVFVSNTNEAFIASSLNYPTLAQLDVDYLGYFHEDGEVVWVARNDREAEKLRPLPDELRAQIRPGKPLMNLPAPDSGVRGILMVSGEPFMVAVRRVLRSDRSEPAPPRGVFLLSKRLDSQVVGRWGEALGMNLQTITHEPRRAPDKRCLPDAQAVHAGANGLWGTTRTQVVGCVVLEDLYGQPAVCLRMEKPRVIVMHARATLFQFVATLGAVIVLTLAAVFAGVHSYVVRPVERLKSQIESIAKRHDLNERLSLPVQEEVAVLAKGVNDLLNSVGAAERSLRAGADRLEKLNRCFLQFGPDAEKNIQSLVHLAGDVLGADCALYSRLQSGLLCTLADWKGPPDLQRKDAPEGHLCFDVIAGGEGRPMIVRNLQRSRYAETDPNVRQYNLQTYVGYPVFCGGRAVGSVCCVYTRDVEPSEEDLRVLGIIAAAVGVEEERREAARRLQQSSEEWRRTFDHIPDPLCIIDTAYVIRQVNRAMLRALGLSENDVVGKTCFECVHQSGAPPHACPHAKVLETGMEHTAEILEEKMGGEYLVACSPIHDAEGRIVGSIHLAKNITEFKAREKRIQELLAESDRSRKALLGILEDERRIEAALRESEARFRDLVGLLPETIFEADAGGRITYANDFGLQRFGYTREDLERGINLRDMVIPAQHPLMEENIRKRLSGMRGATEYMARRKDGSVFPAAVNVAPIYQGREVVGFRGICVDLTDQKKAEEMRIAKETAEQANRTKAEFLAVMSHELRTPLHTIIGFSRAAEEGVYGAVGDAQRAALRYITDAAEHLMQLISDILDMTRIELGRVELTLDEVSLKSVLQECVELMRGRDDAAELTLTLDVAPELENARITADPRRLRQILLNLLSNSVKFNLPGGRIAVQAGFDPGDNKYIRLAVKDTGVGVDDSELPKIFEKFHRGKPPDGKWRDGTGLGLSLSKELVELHGGKIWAEPGEEGRGLNVFFVLPIGGPAQMPQGDIKRG
jgi:PAS domain S-box-containing protein